MHVFTSTYKGLKHLPLFLQSGAKINISDASCPERIVTVTGAIDQIHKAFNLICTKFEDIRVSCSVLCLFMLISCSKLRYESTYGTAMERLLTVKVLTI